GAPAPVFEPLLEAVRPALDHVRDQAAGEAVQRAVLAAIGRPRDDDLAVLLLHVDLAALALGARALGPLHAHELGLDRDLDAVGHGHRLLSDPAHYQTLATSSPPTPARFASWPVMTPWDVDTIVVPMPPWTFGTLPACTYWRR